jgi:hypothetical protein
MPKIEEIIKKMENSPKGIKYKELVLVCNHYFGLPRQRSSSHCVYKTPWQGDPRVNIQNFKGMAKPYQVRQVLKAIKRITDEEIT